MDNELFWKTIKSSFSDKNVTRYIIDLTENGEVLKTKLETAETINNFLENVIENHTHVKKVGHTSEFVFGVY